MPKNRWFDLDVSMPLTEKSAVDLGALLQKDPDESSLGQFLGFESDEENEGQEAPLGGPNQVIDLFEEEKTENMYS